MSHMEPDVNIRTIVETVLCKVKTETYFSDKKCVFCSHG